MNILQLQQLLDRHGSDPLDWPPDLRTAAERLIATDPAAAAAQEGARELDALIARHVQPSPQDPNQAAQASASRVMASLVARPLPLQHRAWRWWPTELASFDFAPAWPRIAALASVGVLGFALGLIALDPRIAAGSAFTRAANADPDLSAIVFDPESVTGLRP